MGTVVKLPPPRRPGAGPARTIVDLFSGLDPAEQRAVMLATEIVIETRHQQEPDTDPEP